MGMKDWIRCWGPAVLVMAIIFIASATPDTNLPTIGEWDLFVKKAGHMIGYALLAITIFHALNYHKGLTRSQLILAFCLAVAYAASDELHQRFTRGRNASIHDVFIDAAGAALGLALWFCLRSHFLRWQKALRSER